MANRNYIEFEPPKDFHMPESSNEMGEFDLVCTFKPTMDGRRICMIKFGDTEMPTAEKDKTEKKPDYKEYSQSITDAADQQEQEQPGY